VRYYEVYLRNTLHEECYIADLMLRSQMPKILPKR